MEILSQKAAPVTAPIRDEDSDDNLAFGLMLSDRLLAEVVEKIESKPITLPDVEQTILGRKTVNSISRSAGTLDACFPKVAEIVADMYWEAVERLGTFGLDFSALEEYHNGRDGEVEA